MSTCENSWMVGETQKRSILMVEFIQEPHKNVCDYIHVSSPRALTTRSCECEFYAITPLNECIPIELLLCLGVHMHAPAYSDRTPQDLKQQLLMNLQYDGRKAYTFGQLRRINWASSFLSLGSLTGSYHQPGSKDLYFWQECWGIWGSCQECGSCTLMLE